ncbi:nitrate/nitrite transporter NrtS [Marinovum sp.]|uniref:nitrate/nitrite transporter NrtS n=1 Tax=Marinovum sp. TaxID=2024839 RepID=UPI002B272236|nr:nitrate/nitrite transporter NrtS [Marinovum sp.]
MPSARNAVPDAAGARFLDIALRRSVVLRAARVSLVVGVVLGLLNHGDALLAGTMTMTHFAKICLTFLVPYSVSTYSSVLAIRERSAA